MERMITLWYESCQSRLCLKRLGLTWINATPYKQFAELFSKRAFDSHPIVLFLQYAKRKGTHFRVPFLVERMMGIEPTRSAWKAEVLPLNYIRLSATLLLYHAVWYMSRIFLL